MSAGCDSPKFESRTRCSRNSPFRKPHTVIFQVFRRVRVHPAPRGLYGANFGLSDGPPTPQPPNGAFRPEMPVPISASSRGFRRWLPPPLAHAHSRSAGPVPARKTRHGEPCNLALFSATGFLALSVPLFHRICRRQENGRFPDTREASQIPASATTRRKSRLSAK